VKADYFAPSQIKKNTKWHANKPPKLKDRSMPQTEKKKLFLLALAIIYPLATLLLTLSFGNSILVCSFVLLSITFGAIYLNLKTKQIAYLIYWLVLIVTEACCIGILMGPKVLFGILLVALMTSYMLGSSYPTIRDIYLWMKSPNKRITVFAVLYYTIAFFLISPIIIAAIWFKQYQGYIPVYLTIIGAIVAFLVFIWKSKSKSLMALTFTSLALALSFFFLGKLTRIPFIVNPMTVLIFLALGIAILSCYYALKPNDFQVNAERIGNGLLLRSPQGLPVTSRNDILLINLLFQQKWNCPKIYTDIAAIVIGGTIRILYIGVVFIVFNEIMHIFDRFGQESFVIVTVVGTIVTTITAFLNKQASIKSKALEIVLLTVLLFGTLFILQKLPQKEPRVIFSGIISSIAILGELISFMNSKYMAGLHHMVKGTNIVENRRKLYAPLQCRISEIFRTLLANTLYYQETLDQKRQLDSSLLWAGVTVLFLITIPQHSNHVSTSVKEAFPYYFAHSQSLQNYVVLITSIVLGFLLFFHIVNDEHADYRGNRKELLNAIPILLIPVLFRAIACLISLFILLGVCYICNRAWSANQLGQLLSFYVVAKIVFGFIFSFINILSWHIEQLLPISVRNQKVLVQ
jgi:hypothetical protein